MRLARRHPIVISIAAAVSLSLASAAPASAADTLTVTATSQVNGTVELRYLDGRVEQSSPFWNGIVPTGVRVPVPKSSYGSCLELTFQVQAVYPADQMKDVDADFEVWSTGGVKVMSDSIWGYADWNPGGGPTQVKMLTCDPLPDGTYNLFVTTKNELSTNGLISRYLEGKQTLPFTVTNASYVTCKKDYTTKIFAGKKCPRGWKKVKA